MTLGYDDFKEVNDKWGHYSGDKLLCFVAETIRKNIGNIDTLAIVGGDEFALLLPVNGYDETNDAIFRIHKNLRLAIEKRNWNVTFNIGTVTCQGIEVP